MEEELRATKAVLDTNVYISSVFWEKGNPHKIIEKAIEGKIEVLISKEILEEIEKILKRDFSESKDFIDEQIKLIKEYTEIVEITESVDIIKEDPEDNKIINCALSANADYIVSGDNHLLKIKEHKDIKILSPADFIKILQS